MGYELSKACRVVATNCCICNRPLVDCKSVELGIGPVCRAKYFKDVVTSPEQVDAAMRLLWANAPLHITEAAVERQNSKNPGQQIANLLIYWFSCQYQANPKMVLTLTPALRALGYSVCADKLEENLSVIRLVFVDGDDASKQHLEVHSPFNYNFIEAVKSINGRKAVYEPGTGKKAGRQVFKCWSIPATKDARIELFGALKASYPGQLGIGPKGVFDII